MSTKRVVGDCRLERSASEGPSGLSIKTLPIARVRRLGRGWKNPSRTDNAFDGVPPRWQF